MVTPPSALSGRLRVAIDELRMQMLGTEVLFGFELEGTFKDGIAHLTKTARVLDFVALISVVLMLAALIGAPAQHRLVEQGNASTRLIRMIGRHASGALFLFAIVLGCDGFVITEFYLGPNIAVSVGFGTAIIALTMWFGVGRWIRHKVAKQMAPPLFEETPLHEKIEQMLTEAWVILPGATGIFGFQLLITMATSFEHLSHVIQVIHFAAIGMTAVAIILLVTPAAIHRIAFSGLDHQRSHRIGSLLITIAPAPLAAGVAADVYVAGGRLLGFSSQLVAAPVLTLVVLLFAWYMLPLFSRRDSSVHRTQIVADEDN